MDTPPCETDNFHHTTPTDFPNRQILGELAAKCEEFSAGMGSVECPKAIPELLGLLAKITGELCYSGPKAISDQEIEEPEPEPDEVDPYGCGEPAGYDPDEFDATGGLDADEDSAEWDEGVDFEVPVGIEPGGSIIYG